ncbi:MAG: uracil phosphoribosyltransferase [Candidatus Heimdallarchaeaceae archaeon]
MAYEVASLLETEETTVETPLGIAKARKHKDAIIVITVLRAAVPMAEGVIEQNPKQIIILSAIASTYGIKRIKDRVPDVTIFAGDIDKHLNEKGYIIPGLGDAGDRAFNT